MNIFSICTTISSYLNINFFFILGNHDWLGCWGKHMKSQGFKAIREYQKVNKRIQKKSDNMKT